MKKLNEKPNNNDQDIVFTDSKIVTFFETLLFVLHTITFILGFLVIFDIILNEGLIGAHHWLEILTLLFILIIIIIPPTKILIYSKLTKNIFREFWGENEIESITHIPLEMENYNSTLSKIKKERVVKETEKIEIGMKHSSKIPFKRIFYANIEHLSSEKVDVEIVFSYILVDFKKEKINVFGTLIHKNNEDSMVKDFIFELDSKNKTAKWSGLAPGHIQYGEWIWK